MLDLDYAFLADYASIQDSKLTTVGASFTRMRVPQVPTHAFIAVAGRLRCDAPHREEIMMTLRMVSPGEDPLVFETSYQLDASLKRRSMMLSTTRARLSPRTG